jgi:histidine triad (HIT) family protein
MVHVEEYLGEVTKERGLVADNCLICDIIAGASPSARVYETETVYAFRDINPVAPTHILIVPKKHIARVADLTEEDASLMGEILLAAREIAQMEGVAEAYRLVINNGTPAGQSIFHIHLHLLANRRMSWPPG